MTKKNDYFQTICKVSRAYGTTLTKEALLDLIVQSAIETMKGKAACLFLADEEKDVFVPVTQKGLSDDYFHAGPMRAKKVVSDVLEGEHLSIRDATTDPRLENHEAKKAEGIASILVVPVMVGDKAIGILSLYTSEPRDFSKDEIETWLARFRVSPQPKAMEGGGIDPVLKGSFQRFAEAANPDDQKAMKQQIAGLMIEKGIPPEKVKSFLEGLTVERVKNLLDKEQAGFRNAKMEGRSSQTPSWLNQVQINSRKERSKGNGDEKGWGT